MNLKDFFKLFKKWLKISMEKQENVFMRYGKIFTAKEVKKIFNTIYKN